MPSNREVISRGRAFLAWQAGTPATTARRERCGDESVVFFLVNAFPATRGQPFERPVADLVVHPVAARDPVSEVDIRQLSLGGAPDVVENDVGSKSRSCLCLRVVEAVDHRQPITLEIR